MLIDTVNQYKIGKLEERKAKTISYLCQSLISAMEITAVIKKQDEILARIDKYEYREVAQMKRKYLRRSLRKQTERSMNLPVSISTGKTFGKC